MSEKSKISSFAKVRRGASPRPIGDPKYFGGEVGWIRISDVTASNKYLKRTEQYVSLLGESLSVRVDKGDLIMSICGTIGRPIIIDFPSCIHDGFVQLYDIKNADTEYLYYILQFHEKDLEGKGQPGTQVNLNTGIVEDFEIFLPSFPIQRHIAQILSICDAVIEKPQAAIAKYRAIKQGMLHDLFTRGIDIKTGKLRPKYEDAPGLYKESKLGMVPKEWEVRHLEKLTTQIGDGIHTTPKYSENTDYYFINGNNLSDGEILIGSALCVNEDEYKKHFKELSNRTILYSINGTIGNIAIYKNQKVILGKSACYIACKQNVNLVYVFFILQTFQVQKFYELEMTGERRKQQHEGYEPTVSVSTKKINNKLELTAKDNGNGIPQKVVDKIFQPFFTTKPTGVGTGLGLSLSYDIVKAHGGDIKVNTIEGEFTEFVIHLPILL